LPAAHAIEVEDPVLDGAVRRALHGVWLRIAR